MTDHHAETAAAPPGTVTVYLDVDGVINAVTTTFPKQQTGWEGDWSTTVIEHIRVTWAHELVTALNGLAAFPHIRFVWLTSWGRDAPEHLCPAIGLHGELWPVLTGADYDTSYAWWKLDAIRDDMTANPAGLVVWVDDELGRELAAAVWAAEQGGPPVMVIAPTAHIGLTREHLERIRALVMG